MIEQLNRKQMVEAIQPQIQNLNFAELSHLAYDFFRANTQTEISYSQFVTQNQKITEALYLLGQQISLNSKKFEQAKPQQNQILQLATELFEVSTNPLSFFMKEVVGDIFGQTGRKIFDTIEMANLIASPDPKEALLALVSLDTKLTQKLTDRQRLERLYNSN